VSSLRELVTPKALRLRAGDRTFVRGREYADEGRVADLAEEGAAITGIVEGTHDYVVVLEVDSDTLAGTCDCPMGETGAFCKHLVALGLAWLASGGGLQASDPQASDPQASDPQASDPQVPVLRRTRLPRITTGDVRSHLAAMDHDALVDLVLAQAERDDLLRERLMLFVATAEAGGAGVALVRRAIDQAVRLPGYLRYADVYGYVSGIHDALDLLDDLLRTGQADAVIDLAEHALRRVEGAMDHVDDSDGGMGGVLGRLGEVHLAACVMARPDPVALAGRLFAWELDGQWDVFTGAPLVYADVLGEAGIAEYRRLAEAKWVTVPQLGPSAGAGRSFEGRRFRITSIMESLARATGDIDELLAVKARDLSSPYAFLDIAGVCIDAGRGDEALDWAEQGVRAFPDSPDARLREFLADRYHDRSRHDDAIALVWAPFEARPTVDGFVVLRAHASRAGAWPAWRERAIDTARAAVVEAQRSARPPVNRWDNPADGSSLVRMLLLEGDVETAWRDASVLGCSEPVWRELARLREIDHPADAIPIYQREVEVLLRTTSNEGYAAAVERLVHIRDLMDRIESADVFPGYLAGVRAAHARKRNFMKLLDATQWSGG
jgi:uncharacterized Zn finger protein